MWYMLGGDSGVDGAQCTSGPWADGLLPWYTQKRPSSCMTPTNRLLSESMYPPRATNWFASTVSAPGRAGTSVPAGDAGNGATGDVGVFGAVGDVGAVGEVGALGPGNGVTGVGTGPVGVAPGPVGDVGEVGEVGDVGEGGEVGDVGEGGDVGDVGDVGEAGEVGALGAGSAGAVGWVAGVTGTGWTGAVPPPRPAPGDVGCVGRSWARAANGAASRAATTTIPRVRDLIDHPSLPELAVTGTRIVVGRCGGGNGAKGPGPRSHSAPAQKNAAPRQEAMLKY